MNMAKVIAEGKTPLRFQWTRDPVVNDSINFGLFYIGGGALVGYTISLLSASKGGLALGLAMGCGMTLNFMDTRNLQSRRFVLHNTEI